ncbi:MAG: hypothetical protein QXW97_02135 [Candidatus Pacearchaeota archaeon]
MEKKILSESYDFVFFKRLNLGDYKFENLARAIEECNNNNVLLSDVTFIGDIKKISHVPLSLASDGLYFFGKVIDLKDDSYNFEVELKGRVSSYKLNKKNLAGLLKLEGEPLENFPSKFRKVPYYNFDEDFFYKNKKKIFLFSFDDPRFVDQKYYIGTNVDPQYNRFNVMIPSLRIQNRKYVSFNFSYNSLTGLFISE